MSNPRYLVDARPLGGASGSRGIGTYARELLVALAGIGAGDRLELLTYPGQALPPEVSGLGLRGVVTVPRLDGRLQPVADPLLVSLAVRRRRPSLYHAVEWGQPWFPAGIPVAVTVHDLIPFLHPQLYRWIRRERLLALRLLRSAGAVVTPSRATARDVERLARVDPARIVVIPHGVDPGFSPAGDAAAAAVRQRFGLGERRFLLFPGTLDAHKRRDALAAVVAAVRRDHDVSLVVAGSQGIFAPEIAAALDRHGIAGHAHLLGFVSREDLVALYSAAALMVFPSACEGFGLPVLEALGCGTPVVAFDNSALPEVAGDAAVLVADGDVAAMAAAAGGLLAETPAARAARVESGRAWAGTFTWERSARDHLGLYERLSGRG